MNVRVGSGFLSVARALALATVSAGALSATQAMAQTATQDDEAAVAESADDRPTDVVVVGIRGSIDSANAKKRKSKQIVDSVVSEDVGKLPDNNVPEALSRVSGVQIDRAHGEGQGVTVRGLSGIQTTINGNESSSAGGRSLNLADIPAELLKSVEVYKTRSADQIEGGIAGTVNVELRRPLDLQKGLTVAGSFRETFSDLGDTKSPYASLLLAERFDTPIGEMGFLLNGSYTKNNYFENFVLSESASSRVASPMRCCLYRSRTRSFLMPSTMVWSRDRSSVRRSVQRGSGAQTTISISCSKARISGPIRSTSATISASRPITIRVRTATSS
jgi:iron complex outermembrane receptor protein